MLNLGKIKYSFVLKYERWFLVDKSAFVHLQFLCQANLYLGYHISYLGNCMGTLFFNSPYPRSVLMTQVWASQIPHP